jgi:hypothetical protein
MIMDAAASIRATATTKANPVAEALGLGPCLLGADVGSKDTGGRPTHFFTAKIGANGANTKV